MARYVRCTQDEWEAAERLGLVELEKEHDKEIESLARDMFVSCQGALSVDFFELAERFLKARDERRALLAEQVKE